MKVGQRVRRISTCEVMVIAAIDSPFIWIGSFHHDALAAMPIGVFMDQFVFAVGAPLVRVCRDCGILFPDCDCVPKYYRWVNA